MPHIYPPAAPTLSGDVLTISRFLSSPAAVQRRLRTITQQRFIADVLLSGRYQAVSGSIVYETGESIYTQKAPEIVTPGGEYPRSPAAPGAAAVASTGKWGQDVPITDEHVGRYGRRAVDVGLLKIGNYIIRIVDSVFLTALNAAVTQSSATVGIWSGGSADPLLDAMLAAANIRALDQGYDPDVAAMSDVAFARFVANSKIIAGLSRERDTTITSAGIAAVQEIAGLTPLPTNNLPLANAMFVGDSTMLGGVGYERIPSPEYQGDPATGVESYTRRNEKANDEWIARGRRPVTPVIQEPAAAWKVTGVV